MNETTIVADPSPIVLDQTPLPGGIVEDEPAPAEVPPAAAPVAGSATDPSTQVPPDPMEDLLARGDYAFAQGQYAEARTLYQQANIAAPESPHPNFAYALGSFAMADYKAAAAALRRALPLFPELARSQADLREAYRIPGDFQRHLNALVTYTQQVEGDADGWLLLGYLQYFSGARPAAFTSLAKALSLNPDDQAVRAFLESARVLRTEAETRPFPPVDPDAPGVDAAPSSNEAPAAPTDPKGPSAQSDASDSPDTTVPKQPLTGSGPGVSVEFGPPGADSSSNTDQRTDPA